MFSIGEFARHGRVSVRMLRHYDAIGLIRPACVDAATGYRFYQARWIDANGYRSVGYAREVTLEWSADPERWVTELQQPIDATGG